MTKEYLEALKHFVETSVWNDDEFHEIWDNGNSDLEIVKSALQRLEAIDNAKPSEELESLEYFELDLDFTLERTLDRRFINVKSYEEILNNIKQALIKAQEQEKVIKILFEKNVRIYWIKSYSCVKSYNNGLPKKEQLTQEEFDTLKRYCNEQNNK